MLLKESSERKDLALSTDVFISEGVCPICESDAVFIAHNSWFRDHLICKKCKSIPRERALMAALHKFTPVWREMVIHESSPSTRGTSLKLKKENPNYIETQFFSDKPLGDMVQGFRNENLSNLTFEDNSIDIHITQDVMEHVLDIDACFAEIARTLKPHGMHIFTVPLVQGVCPTVQRAAMDSTGGVVHWVEPVFHGNPVCDEGSLVVWDWGYDIVHRIYEASRMPTIVLQIDDINSGIKAEYIDVLISIKA